MCKSGNNITTNLVYTLDTEEKNGVEISIKNLFNMYSYLSALDYVVFFPNVYVDCAVSDFNKLKIKHFNKYASCSKGIKHKILLGNVLYPLDASVLSIENKDFVNKIINTGIVIKFNIGELDITPNRENIIYTEKTKKVINTRIEEAKEEVYEEISKFMIKDYSNIFDYTKCYDYNLYYIPEENTFTNDYSSNLLRFQLSEIHHSITYKNNDLSSYYKLLKAISGLNLINHRNYITADKIYNSDKLPWHVRSNDIRLNSTKILIIPSTNRLTSTLKSYLKENYSNYNIVTEFTFDDFKSHLKICLGNIANPDYDEKTIEYIKKEFYDAILEKSIKFDFTTDTKFLAYKEEISKNKLPTQKIQDVILYVWANDKYSDYSFKRSKYFKTLEDAIGYIKSQKLGVIISNISTDDYTFANIINTRGYMYITANKQTVSELQKIKLNNIVPMVDFLKDKTIIKLHNYICNPNFVYLQENILDTIPEFSKKPIVEMQNLYNKYYKNNCFFSYVKGLKNIESDSYIDSVCSKAKFYYEKYMEAQDIVTDGNFRNSELLVEAVIKKKRLYRMPYLSYKRINKNKLLNVLCSR